MDIILILESVLIIVVSTYIVNRSRQNYVCHKQYNVELEEKAKELSDTAPLKLQIRLWFDISVMVLGIAWIILYTLRILNVDLGVFSLISIRTLVAITLAFMAGLMNFRQNGGSKCKKS